MEALEAILSRRSIRHYTAERIPKDVVHELLEAAMSAPSAHNKQTWHFVIIYDKKIFDEIRKVHPWSSMLTSAPLAILVCGDLQVDSGLGFWVQDCSAATQNILLAAHAKGLGSVWVGIYPVEQKSADVIKRMVKLPEHIVPFSLIPVGYPAEMKARANRYNPAKVHENSW
jgi:nitroreductase